MIPPRRRYLSRAARARVPDAPRTYYAWAARAPSKRALWDATITEILAGYYPPGPDGNRKPESL